MPKNKGYGVSSPKPGPNTPKCDHLKLIHRYLTPPNASDYLLAVNAGHGLLMITCWASPRHPKTKSKRTPKEARQQLETPRRCPQCASNAFDYMFWVTARVNGMFIAFIDHDLEREVMDFDLLPTWPHVSQHGKLVVLVNRQLANQQLVEHLKRQVTICRKRNGWPIPVATAASLQQLCNFPQLVNRICNLLAWHVLHNEPTADAVDSFDHGANVNLS